MPKKRLIYVVMTAMFLVASIVYAACTGSDTCTMTIYSPSANPVDSCQIVIDPVGGTDCDQQSNPSCSRTVTCQERGTYTASIPGSCHVDGVSPLSVDVLTCDYDDCQNCCESGTSYVWNLPGEPPGANECCEDDASEFYQPADVGAQDLCCNNNADCAINGVCITSGSTSGNNCCYDTSLVDSVRPSCSTYSSGATCYYNGVDQCNQASGWECSYSTKQCDASNDCADSCGSETCFYSNSGFFDWGTLPAIETACSDTYDNDCDGDTDGNDDDCWDCDSGPCCDTFTHTFRPNIYLCNATYQTLYNCTDGTGCDSDVYVRYRERYCPGDGPDCTGSITNWGPPQVHDDCNFSQHCEVSQSQCVYDLACEDECTGGVCCDTTSHPYQALPAGTICNTTDVCNANQLCTHTECDGLGSCNVLGGCSDCLGRTRGECGDATGNCLSQPGNDDCEFVGDSWNCASCDDECDGSLMCVPVATSPCCYSYSQCIVIVNDPQRQPGEEPSDEGQCICHFLFQDPNCI